MVKQWSRHLRVDYVNGTFTPRRPDAEPNGSVSTDLPVGKHAPYHSWNSPLATEVLGYNYLTRIRNRLEGRTGSLRPEAPFLANLDSFI